MTEYVETVRGDRVAYDRPTDTGHAWCWSAGPASSPVAAVAAMAPSPRAAALA